MSRWDCPNCEYYDRLDDCCELEDLCYEDGYEQGGMDRKDKDIDDLQHILLKNVNDHEQALIEIIDWLNEQLNEQIGEKNE